MGRAGRVPQKYMGRAGWAQVAPPCGVPHFVPILGTGGAGGQGGQPGEELQAERRVPVLLGGFGLLKDQSVREEVAQVLL